LSAGVVGNAAVLDLAESGIEFRVVDQEGVVLGADVLGVDEVERDAVAGAHRHEMAPGCFGLDAQDVGQEPGRGVLVLGRNDDVIERCHATS